MAFFTAGFCLLLFFLFWGAGLALLITPRRWRAGWPAMCAPAGIALQSGVVWFGALSGAAGTQVYAVASMLLPTVLLLLGLWRALGPQRRKVGEELRKWQGVGVLMAVVLNALLIPFSAASKTLTSSSLGSCDAADYAAGARVLLEFSRGDRSGFMGLTEVVQLHSVDNFFDHWIRLNHFTPSALVALSAAIFSYQPYEIISVMSAVFVALSLPTVFWLARSTFRYGRVSSAWITTIYGLSPLLWYAVYHVAMSQILAAIAIALLNGCALALWRERADWRRGLVWGGLLAVSYWMIMGAYNFIVIVCLVPALAYAGGETLWRKKWRQFARWLVLVVSPLLVVALVFTQRTLGLVERFLLFQQYDFGWPIPLLSPEGWLGMVGSVTLSGLPLVLRWAFGTVAVVLLGAALIHGMRKRSKGPLLALCATAPILLGYGFLEWRAQLRGTNASYDAYKLLCVFYPGLLAGLGYWLTLARSGSRWARALVGVFALTVLIFNGYAAHRNMRRMQSPPLLVDRALIQLQRLEAVPEVTSVNMLIGDFWGRLWANSFLLHKAQYFPTHTYEGRRNTALKGEWDLLGGIITQRRPEEPESLRLTPPYSLVNVHSRYYVKISTGDGWYDPELIAKAGTYWRWTRGNAALLIDNPQAASLRANLKYSMRSLVDRDVQIWVNGKQIRSDTVGTQLRWLRASSLLLPPGRSIIEFRSNVLPISPGPNDGRKLGIAVYSVELDLGADTDPSQS